jgi:hypothetical protein
MTWCFAPRLARNCALNRPLGTSDPGAELTYRPCDRRSTSTRNMLPLKVVHIVRSAIARPVALDRYPARSDLAKHTTDLRTNLSQVGLEGIRRIHSDCRADLSSSLASLLNYFFATSRSDPPAGSESPRLSKDLSSVSAAINT